jgi:hypothetical protein
VKHFLVDAGKQPNRLLHYQDESSEEDQHSDASSASNSDRSDDDEDDVDQQARTAARTKSHAAAAPGPSSSAAAGASKQKSSSRKRSAAVAYQDAISLLPPDLDVEALVRIRQQLQPRNRMQKQALLKGYQQQYEHWRFLLRWGSGHAL